MIQDQGGWLWIIIDVAFVAALAAAIVYGTFMWRRRHQDPISEAARDRATVRAYDESGENRSRTPPDNEAAIARRSQ